MSLRVLLKVARDYRSRPKKTARSDSTHAPLQRRHITLTNSPRSGPTTTATTSATNTPQSNVFLVFGLGNPGPAFAQTRHNIGFLAVDHIAKAHKLNSKTLSLHTYYEWEFEGKRVILVKPMTFINRSGDAYKTFTKHFKVGPQNTVVVYDSFHMPYGSLRLRSKGSDGGHNGIGSILQVAGSQDVPQLKIGIDPPRGGSHIDHVLSKFDATEVARLDNVCSFAEKCLRHAIVSGIVSAMNSYNKSYEDLLRTYGPADSL